MITRRLPAALAAVTVLSCGALTACTPLGASALKPHFLVRDGLVSIALEHGTLSIDPTTLETKVAPALGSPTIASVGVKESPVKGKVHIDEESARWTLNDGTEVNASLLADSMSVAVTLSGSGEEPVAWPVSSPDASTGAVQFANGSGQSIPVRDKFWTQTFDGLVGSEWSMTGDLTLPVWGITNADGGSGVAFYTPTDIGSALAFSEEEGTLVVSATHDTDTAYTVVITPTDGNPIRPADPYRKFLQAEAQFTSLSDKIAANPNVEKLIGAPHAYVWGTGRDRAFLRDLQEVGLERAWLGYDADGNDPSKEYVGAAQDAGLLVGPYDTWDNAQDPEEADTPSSVWAANLYPDGCVIDADGNRVEGFGGRGCYLSTAALEQAEQTHGVLTERVTTFTKSGQLSYFLDVDAAGQLFTDYSDAHPQTRAEDRARRLARMDALATGKYSTGSPLVLGSETAAGWANSVLSYSHGSSTPVFDGLWAAQKEAENWGGYWPQDRPRFFFQGADLEENLATAMFSPQYRIPLYQAALHDSVVTTDRWEIDTYKVNGYSRDRTLLAMLHNSPLNYVWDRKAVSANAEEIRAVSEFFAAIQGAAGTEALTTFEVLDENGLVQRTKYAGGLSITANFGEKDAMGVNAGCVVASGDSVDAQLCL